MSDIAELRLLFYAGFALILGWIVYMHRWHRLFKTKKPRKPINNRRKKNGKRKPTPKSRK